MKRLSRILNLYSPKSPPILKWWIAWSQVTRPGKLLWRVASKSGISMNRPSAEHREPLDFQLWPTTSHLGILSRHPLWIDRFFDIFPSYVTYCHLSVRLFLINITIRPPNPYVSNLCYSILRSRVSNDRFKSLKKTLPCDRLSLFSLM